MRSKGLLVVGLIALAVGIVGLIVALPAAAATTPAGGWQFGPSGMMGPQGMTGMMGGPVAADAAPIGIDRASTNAREYIASLGDQNLALAEVMEFGANYYAQAAERDTGLHAFELLIDKYTGAVYPEMGPNMVWNTKYGMMGGMMGRWHTGPGQATTMAIDSQRASALARQYLKTQGLRLDVAEPDRFYGYYTLHTMRGREIEGMLSVNGATGEIWYHAWHGPFIQERIMQTGIDGAGR